MERYEDHSVRELWGVGVTVWANCGVGGLWFGWVAVWGSCGRRQLQCVAAAV